MPNPDILLSPITTQEAVFSSRIEGTQATLGEVLRFEAVDELEQETRRLAIHEIMNYHTDRQDPLVQLAIVYTPFEISHPFYDRLKKSVTE